MTEKHGNNYGFEFTKNGHFDSSQGSSEHFTDPVRPSDPPLFGGYTSSHSTSRKSSIDSLVAESDWSDTSFYALPSFKKVNQSTAIGSSQLDNSSANHSQGHYSHVLVFPEYEVQQNAAITRQPYHPLFTKPTKKTSSTNKPKPKYTSRPFKAMDRPTTNYNNNHTSPDSDDTIGHSSSGIASDLESPRSLRSSFVETPRGLAQNLLQDNPSSHKEPVGARSLSFARTKAVVAPLSRSSYQVQSNVETDGLLLSMHHYTGIPQMKNGTGIPQMKNGTGVPKRNIRNDTGIPYGNDGITSRNDDRDEALSSLYTGSPQRNNVSNGSLYRYSDTGIPHRNGGVTDESLVSVYNTTGIPHLNGVLNGNSKYGNTGIPQPNGVTDESLVSVYNTTGIPHRNGVTNGSSKYGNTGIPQRNNFGNGSVNMYSDTGILKQYDKVTAKNFNGQDIASHLVLNNGVRSNELQDSWTRRKIIGLNNTKDWKHSSLLNSFSVESSRHVASSVWAMKSLEQETAPALNPELLLKARLFRRWHQRARLQRLDRIENENKMNQSVEFWRNNTIQKHFSAWKTNRTLQESKAQKVYRRHMLETGLKGLQFAVQVNSQSSNDLKKRVDSRLMAKFWLKWQNRFSRKKAEDLRSAFNRWRVVHLEGNRDKILEGIANKHIMTRSYFKWKIKYSVEQNNSVANLNFQITLITKCWHSWRIYAAQRVVKIRTNEVARIHYENQLQAHVFKVWLERRKRCSIASNLLKRRIVVKAFYSWKNWTEYAKVIHQRFQSMCKEYYNKALLKQSFVKWKQKLMLQQAINYHSNLLQKRVYRLWFLRYRRNVIHRHLCKAMSKKGKKRRFFRRWLNVTHSQREKRQAFVTILQKMLLSKMMLTWKKHTYEKMSLKQRFERLMQKKDTNTNRIAMDKWLFAMKVASFKKQAKINWTNRCVRNACTEWKMLLKRKYLEETLIETRPERDLWLLRVFWNTWKRKKEVVDREQEHVNSVATILVHNFKRRIFLAWRVTNQQEQVIAPMVVRRERKHLAKVFDAWRLHIYRQKYIVNQHTRADDKLMDKYFMYWREKGILQIKGRNAVTQLQFSKMSRAFAAWRGHIRDIRHERLKERAEKLKLMSFYFKTWTQRLETQVEATEQQRGKQIRKELLVRWVFKYWRHAADCRRQSLLETEEQVKSNIRYLKLRRYMDVWLRWHRVAHIVRNHLATRQEQLMSNVFHAWSAVIKDEINAQLNRFSTNLALDSSMGSNMGTSQLLRSTLDSNVGSFLRSTLDSTGGSLLRSTLDSTDSVSSGYWTTQRRGSGSVFPIHTSGVSRRDDDVASLPGRIDHPDSPRFRVASPITLIRESNNVAHVTQPFAVNSSSSSPSPSPPELHLSLASSTESNDCVFSPVKERGSSFLSHNEFVRRQSSMDDDEFDSMSMASGLSTASVRDKEMVIVDTIRHWLFLPLSLTFRTWLKYTRKKKLLRELLYFAKEKKSSEILSSTFQRWRRKLYVTVASRQYRLNSTRLRCLRAWHAYVEHRQLKEKSIKSAETLNRTLLLGRFFNSWKSKCTAKLKLQSIVGQWQKKAIVTEKHKAIEEKVQSQLGQRTLRQRFQYWVLMTRKSQEAKQFYMERLLPRTFLAWHQYSCMHSNNCKKSSWFKDHRVLSMAFREWKRRFESQRVAHDYAENKEVELCVDILKTWHEWATGVCARRRLWRSYHKSLQIKTMKQIFTEWSNQVKRRESAEMMYKQSLMRSILLSWQDVCQTAKEDRDKAAALKKTCSDVLLRQSFTFWHCLFIHSQHATNLAQQRDQMLIKECFQDWRDHTLSAKANNHYVKWNLKKVYYQWYDKCLARKRARQMIRSWKIIAEDSKALNSKAMEVCQLTDKKILHQTFMFWMQETHKIQKAKHHYAVTACRSSLNAWYSYAHTKVRCRRVLAQAEAAKNKALLIESFSLWRDSLMLQVLNQEKLEEYMQAKELQQLQSCMMMWRKYTLKCRAQKHHDSRLVFKSFYDWRLRLTQKKGLEKVLEKVFYRRIRQAAIHWKQWTIKTKQQQTQADEFQVTVGVNIVKNSFTYWVAATQKSCQTKDRHDKILLKRTLLTWKDVVCARIKEKKTIEKFQMKTMAKKVGVMFREWQSAFQQAQMYNKLVGSQLKNHNKLVLNGCMRQWKKYHQKCQADKHYNIVLVARFFLEWKLTYDERLLAKDREQVQEEKAIKHYHRHLRRLCFRSWYQDVRVEKYLEMKQQKLVEKHFRLWQKKSNLKSIASQLGDQQTYAKYWSKWRNQLVRKRVSELMMKHEEKKLLSEVFGAWYKTTMIQRMLLHEWNIAIVEKWFRKWMHKYNES